MPSTENPIVPEIRPVTTELGFLTRADGSAQFCHGDTTVIAAVYGPVEVKISKQQTEKSTVEVVYKPKVGLPGCSDRTLESLIGQVCEAIILTSLHPRAAISVVIQSVQDSGAFTACCINAACLALLDAAVPLSCTVAAATCCIQPEGEITLDPTAQEEKTAKACMTFAFDSKGLNIVLANCTGTYTTEQYQMCMSTCKRAAEKVFNVHREALQRKLLKTV